MEEKSQLAFLAHHGCNFAQGFYFGRPMLFEDLVNILKNAQAV
ncbi:MAG: hypothetical protein JKY90_03295 [Gammaproteobacteria bacterium]|nr:hypothetical protein [Gammaproteobacteria bacterium]